LEANTLRLILTLNSKHSTLSFRAKRIFLPCHSELAEESRRNAPHAPLTKGLSMPALTEDFFIQQITRHVRLHEHATLFVKEGY
jgi:hypothetical protein